MRSILFIALGSLAAFLAGLAGTYFVMPVVAPEFVEAERVRADSLARLDSLALADSLPLADGLALADSLVVPDSLVGADSLAATDSLAVPDSLATHSTAALRDSLATLQRRLADYEAQVATYEAQTRKAAAQQTQAADLASTLVKLENRELARILGNLDLDVLELLYAQSTSRNRARLLGALEPSRAAAFVRRATSSGPAPSLSTEPAEPGTDASTPR